MMPRHLLLSLTLAVLSLSSVNPALARDLTYQEKLSDLDQAVSIMKAGYGPLQYKKTQLGIDIDEVRDRYAWKLRLSRSNADFYYLLVQFVAEFRDSHFAASLPSDLTADLHFLADLVAGKVVIDTIDRAALPQASFPFERGDEILAWNGVPVGTVLDDLQKQLGAGYELTARRKAAMRLAQRSGKTFPIPAPSSTVQLTIQSRSRPAPETVTLTWDVKGEPVDEMPKPLAFGIPEEKPEDLDRLAIDTVEDGYRCSGTSRIEIPAGATVIRTMPFVAYYYPTPSGNLGYLRIGEYQPVNSEGAPEYDLRFSQYEQAVSVLEQNTIGLVIDQDHNCGGSVDYMHRMLSLFMDRPFKPLQFELLAMKEQVLLYRNWMRSLPAGSARRDNVTRAYNLLNDTWIAGGVLTSPIAIDGAQEIPLNWIRYTKPVLVLIDELAGSGGDAFPAMLQGFGRAKLLGTRTMGAGGNVREFPPLYYSQIGFRLTKSLFLRPDGIPVENNGAVPDVPYTMTLDDFVAGYRNYRDFFTTELLKLVNLR